MATYNIYLVIVVLILHFISDFLFQTDKMAKDKSSSNLMLTKHVLVYGIMFVCLLGPIYALVNCGLHWITDYFSSRVTKKLWQEQRVHDFFVVIGLDQLIHTICLVVTIPLIWWPLQ